MQHDYTYEAARIQLGWRMYTAAATNGNAPSTVHRLERVDENDGTDRNAGASMISGGRW